VSQEVRTSVARNLSVKAILFCGEIAVRTEVFLIVIFGAILTRSLNVPISIRMNRRNPSVSVISSSLKMLQNAPLFSRSLIQARSGPRGHLTPASSSRASSFNSLRMETIAIFLLSVENAMVYGNEIRRSCHSDEFSNEKTSILI
jgi:hypothetical protein